MGSVEGRIDAWLRYEHTNWDVDPERLLAWASTAGDDVVAAWDACPRGDHLVGLAGALGLPFVFVVKPLCAAARGALRVVPSREHAPRQLVTQWERWRPPSKPQAPVGQTEAHEAVWKRVNAWQAEVDRETLMVEAVSAPLAVAVRGLFEARFAAFAARSSSDADDQGALRVDDLSEALRVFFDGDRAALTWRSALADTRRCLARGHAFRAAGSLSTAIGSGDMMMSTMERARELGATLDERARAEVVRLGERGTQRVFTEGALVMRHAAYAEGYDRAVATDAFEAALSVGLAASDAQLRALAAGQAPEGPTMLVAIAEALDALADAYEADAAGAQADALREAVPRDEVLRCLERETIFWNGAEPSMAEHLGLLRPPRDAPLK